MNEQPRGGQTLRQILLEQEAPGVKPPDSEQGAEALRAHLVGLPVALREAAAEQILTLVARVLDRRLVELLASGWRTWEQLVQAGRRTLDDPGVVEIVELVDHEISSVQRPYVEVTFDGRKVADVGAEAAVQVILHAVTAVVANGRITSLRSGRADLDAHLSIEGITVAEATRQIVLPVEVVLGDGITLIEGPEPVTILPDAER